MLTKEDKLPYELAHHLLRYDPLTGYLYWKVNIGRRTKEGDRVGCYDPLGYNIFMYKRTQYKVHRVVWLLNYKSWPTGNLDHIDGDPGNNRLENLRIATQQENCYNRRKTTSKTHSQYKGVSLHTPSGKWFAQTSCMYKRVFLGAYNTEEEAKEAYIRFAKEVQKEFYREN